MVLRTIDNIFFAETDCVNQVGYDFPENVGSIYAFPDNYSTLGQRLALLLKEQELRIADTRNICITFSSYLHEGEMELFARAEGKDIGYCNIGVVPEKFNALSEAEKKEYILSQCETVLKAIALDEKDKKQIALLLNRIRKEGENIEIHQQEKSDQNICAKLSFRLYDLGTCQPYLYLMTNSGQPLRKHTLPLSHCYSAAKQQYGTLLIRKDKIIIKPEKNIHSKNLQPLEIIL